MYLSNWTILEFNPRTFFKVIYNKCVYFFNIKLKIANRRFRKMGTVDGLPFPSVRLVYLVSGQLSIEWFYIIGKDGSLCIREILQKNGLDINSFNTVLDFGCGCGRIMRHWKGFNGPSFYGVDYNADLVEWSRKHLPFAKYEVNTLTSRLKFNDAMFDFVYAISVFTHLSKELQFFWMEELKRILKPGGFLIITVHGRTRMHQLSKIQQQQFLAGNFIIAGQQFSGTNLCCTYHPEQYVKKVFAKDFELLDLLTGGARDANQDMYLLRKPRKELLRNSVD